MQNKKNKLKNRAGFSLVELMAVIAIVGIIAAVSWRTLGEAKKSADAQNACEQVAAMINKTRNYALSGRTTWALFRIWNNKMVTINLEGEPASIDTYNIIGGVSCDNVTLDYFAPNAIGSFNGSITCSSGGASRTATVTPYSAVCN